MFQENDFRVSPPLLPSVVNWACLCPAFPCPNELGPTGLSFLWSSLPPPHHTDLGIGSVTGASKKQAEA